jgi:N-acetylglucosaminyldiphosphoundecaprenol N-acetyl-beta-D-mannosaminyltransferase
MLVGSTEENLARVDEALGGRFPGAEIVGRYALPYAHEPPVDEGLLRDTRTTGAQILWVSLGAPKQERWMARAAPLLPGVTLVGIGAAFDFVGGTKPRAPAVMQRMGLEWLHRLASEPRRLASRYVRSNSEFVARTAWELAWRRRRAGHEDGT